MVLVKQRQQTLEIGAPELRSGASRLKADLGPAVMVRRCRTFHPLWLGTICLLTGQVARNWRTAAEILPGARSTRPDEREA
jgi:hypothetical protein